MREAVGIIEGEGCTVEEVKVTGGNHVRYTFTDPRDRRHIVYGALSPSDHRGNRNFRALVRRMIRQPPE